MTKILVVTSSIDLTVDYLIEKYKEQKFFRLNVDLFHDYQILVTSADVTIKSNSWSVTLSEIDSIYYRKPMLPDYSNIFQYQYQPFVKGEIYGFVEGIVESYYGFCLSKPSILRTSNNKIVQCMKARELGLNLPDAYITNSNYMVPFTDELIVKPIISGEIIHEGEKIFVQTNMVDAKFKTNDLKYCPAYFQKFIDKDFDLRVTVVGRSIFPVKIMSSNNIDWRHPGAQLSYELITIPEEIIDKCFSLLDQFSLRFGCIDFVVKGETFYFLEVNANGQWLWLEVELGIDISGSIMRELSC